MSHSHGRARHYYHVHDHDGLDDDNDVQLADEDAAELTPDQVPDQVRLTTVAVHVGATTAHLLVTRLSLRRLGVALMSRYEVVAREDVHRSPIWFVPYRDDHIDVAGLERLLVSGLADAPVSVDELDTGVVLLTGRAALGENATPIRQMIGRAMPRFVCTSAGPRLESRMAAYGSGAARLSAEYADPTANLDVGGETANLAGLENGVISGTTTLNVGGRLVVLDNGVVTRIHPVAHHVATAAGLELAVGQLLPADARCRLAEVLADAVVDVVTKAPADYGPLTRHLLLTEAPNDNSGIKRLLLSGGVAEYLDDPAADATDLGPDLAAELAARLSAEGVDVRPAPERIRASLVGLSQFTTQLSGDTVFVSSDAATPQANLPVVPVDLRGASDDVSADEVRQAVQRGLAASGRSELSEPVAIGLDWNGRPYFRTLTAIAEGVAGAGRTEGAVVVALSQDCARSLGRALREVVPADREVVCIDGLRLSENDFIDVGAPVEHGRIVPVVVRTLLFSESERT